MHSNAHIHQWDDDLYLISLPVPVPGFDGFIGAWVYCADPVVLIDAGPASASPHLFSALAELGVNRLDMILLTHIHIDHAGGVGLLSDRFPGAAVVCHPKGIHHLIDPERLWQGSLKTLGELAEAYGPIAPVPAKRLLGSDQLAHDRIVAIETPGHAAHHCSYFAQGTLFAGEACGVSLPVGDSVYLRPATPPRFFLETSLNSLDKLLRLHPRQICYGHVGRRVNAMECMAAHRDQLIRWKEMIHPFQKKAGVDRLAAIRACADHLVETDPLLKAFDQLPAEVQGRERNFLNNSIMGYWGYLESMS